jgi:predicted  nucleic acid-binding Zn-ribbon protein
MAIINGIQLLHKRYADWSGKSLQAGELGLNLTTLEVRIGTAANQSWEDASVVSCKVEIQGTGKHIVGASYENGKLIITKGTVSYNDLADLPELNYEAAGAVAAHNSAADAHSDIRSAVQDNADAIAKEVEDREGEITRVAGLVTAEENRAKKAEEDLQTAVNGKVAQSAYDTKVGELVAEDQRIAGLVAQEVKDRGDAINGVQGAINTEKGRIDILENTTIPGINAKVKANEDAIKALEGLATSGLSRQVVTELPSVDSALENVIYMILRADNVGAEGGDIYDEYLLMGEEGNKRFELLGNTAVDLTDYYVKSEVYTKGEVDAAIDADVLVVSNALSKEVTDRENAVKGVQDQLDALKGENGYKKEIADAVKVEKERAELAEQGLDGRIDAIEALQLEAGSTYATKAALEAEAKRADEAEKANAALIKTNADDIDSLEGRMTTAEGDIDAVEAAIEVINGEAEGSIKKAVADEAAIRLEKDNALEGRIANLEKVEYTGDNVIIEVSDANVISHKKSGVTASADFGFYAFKVDEYGHVVAAQLITTLDGNAE